MDDFCFSVIDNLEGTEKLRELILYVSMASDTDPKFGSTKLNKVLFYADFSQFLSIGRSISGQDYQKLQWGPAPRAMKPLLGDMVEKQELYIVDREYFGRPQKRPVYRRTPNLGMFTGDEIAMVDSILRKFLQYSGSEISDISHNFAGWKLAKEGETIPYCSVLLDNRPLTEQEIVRANEIDMTGVKELLGV